GREVGQIRGLAGTPRRIGERIPGGRLGGGMAHGGVGRSSSECRADSGYRASPAITDRPDRLPSSVGIPTGTPSRAVDAAAFRERLTSVEASRAAEEPDEGPAPGAGLHRDLPPLRIDPAVEAAIKEGG